MIELSWSRMQVELLDRRIWRTRVELANAIFEYLKIFHKTASAATRPLACLPRSSSRLGTSQRRWPDDPESGLHETRAPQSSIRPSAVQTVRVGGLRQADRDD